MTLQQRIAEAENALHELSLGRQVVEINRGGKSLKYTPADITVLRRYITEMKNQLGGSRRRPMGVSL